MYAPREVSDGPSRSPLGGPGGHRSIPWGMWEKVLGTGSYLVNTSDKGSNVPPRETIRGVRPATADIGPINSPTKA
jgi:hypothetical protein